MRVVFTQCTAGNRLMLAKNFIILDMAEAVVVLLIVAALGIAVVTVMIAILLAIVIVKIFAVVSEADTVDKFYMRD